MNYQNRIDQRLFWVIMVAIFFSCAQEDKKRTSEPNTPNQGMTPESHTQVSQEKEFIELSIKVSSLTELKQGDTVEIKNALRDETYRLVIRKIQESLPGLISITANIETKEEGLATLIVRDGEKLSGMLQFYKENTTFRVSFDSTASRHYLMELSPEEMDELEGSKPLVPPKNQE